MFNAANILEALKNYIHARGGTSNAYNIAEAVNDLNSIPQGSGGDIPPEVTNAIETHGMGWTDEEEVPAINIEWDGNAEGLERDPSGLYAKISDLDIPNDQLVGLKYDVSYVSTHELKKTVEITQEDFESLVAVGAITEDFSFLADFIIVHKDGAVIEDVEFAHKGIYDYAAEYVATYTSRFYKEASTQEIVHQIDQKYIPQSSGGAMIVNLTFVDFDTPITADKTLLELGEAFSNGIPVIARLYVENQIMISALCTECEDPYGTCDMVFGSPMYRSESDSMEYKIIGYRKLDDDEETRIDFWECHIFG